MAKSNTERQAAYRARHLKDECGKRERLNVVIDVHPKRALERLAACYGVTQRGILERILIEAERAALDRAGKIANGETDYYEGRLRLSLEGAPSNSYAIAPSVTCVPDWRVRAPAGAAIS